MERKRTLVVVLCVAVLGAILFTACVVLQGENQPPRVDLLAPAHEATGLELDVLLQWEGQPGQAAGEARGDALAIVGFLVYFAVGDQPYAQPEPTTLQALQKEGLAYGTRYRWKVEAVQSDGQRTCSRESFFTTKPLQNSAPQLGLLNPVNGATGQATQLTLSWEATPGSQLNQGSRAVSLDGFFVYFAKQGESYPGPQWLGVKQLEKEQLEYDTSYKWKVVAVQSDGQVATSAEHTFTTVQQTVYNPPSIQLAAPANGATGQATQLTLTWEATPGSQLNQGSRGVLLQGYHVYLARQGESYAEPRWTTTTQIQETNLEHNATYKWKVTVLQSDGQVATSEERTFSTLESSGAPQVELVGPVNFATGQATSLTLTWEATPGVQVGGMRAVSITGYDVYLAKASEAYGSPEQVPAKELQKANLEHDTQFKWKVVAKQSDGKSTASEQWVFSTVEESYNLPQVTLQNPANASDMASRNPTLTWEATPGTPNNASARAANLESYAVYFAKVGEDYGSPTIVETKSLAKVDLAQYTEYKWKVTAHQSDGQQATTPDATFLTAYTFRMGDTRGGGDGDEKPAHGVLLTYEFEMGKYEVTFDQYDTYLVATGQPTETVSGEGWGRGSRPVIWVCWEDAAMYCNWLSLLSGLPPAYDETTWELLNEEGATTTDITQVKGWRLPTEAEWEYCARGGAADITDGVEANDYRYAGSDTLSEVGWYGDNSGWKSQPVGEKEPNELGLYDMSGNVWEWCHDLYDRDWYDEGLQTNPIGPEVGPERVVRGGGWNSIASYCRASDRSWWWFPSGYASNIGFRLCRTK